MRTSLVPHVTITEVLHTWRGANMAKNTRQKSGEVKSEKAARATKKVVVPETQNEVHSEPLTNEPTAEAAGQDQDQQTTINEVNVNSSTAGETITMASFKFKGSNKQGDGIYTIEGFAGTIRIAKGLVATGAEFPATLEIELPLPEATTKAAKVKETPEERKARLAALTPQEKLDAQEARLKKQAENLAARRAKLFGADAPAEGTGDAGM